MTAGLTDRQRQVLVLLLVGFSTKEAAGQLGVRVRTIAYHSSEACRILGVDRPQELVGRALAAWGLGVEELLGVDPHAPEQLRKLGEVPVDRLAAVRHALADGRLSDELVRDPVEFDGAVRNSHEKSSTRNFSRTTASDTRRKPLPADLEISDKHLGR